MGDQDGERYTPAIGTKPDRDDDHEFPTLDIETDPIDVARQSPPDSLSELLERYDDVVADRDRTQWDWLYNAFPAFRLSCVDTERARQVRVAKLLSTLFITVADDVAERHGDRETFAELANVPFDHQHADPSHPDVDGEIVRFGIDVWSCFRGLYDDSPRAHEFSEQLRFDVRQVLAAIEYSALANHSPELVSEHELWRYDAYNMMVFVHADTDLANAPAFDVQELSALRQALDRTQRMARIGNWLATWKRELGEGDYSSGVVVRAVETNVISAARLRGFQSPPVSDAVEEVVRAIENSTVEDYFLDCWRVEYADAARFGESIESVDLAAYLDGFETILRSHIATRNAT
ncbi:terpene synthase family protein [Natrialba asiatica]|uniref:Uncharacterized protein n=1 Tax=Natrialba asiatica (strain ATCC 700177 / DSM 12278 / JCM 9576 / FERM P-10747 / NBRC 102637 / 172P1) TaxID=29540 RepID=M0AVQ7_NATA1|nr:hypothetical protein [Natrialba asiatica]ELZ02412.1 hypothetical protein C481_07076 [Natrialba asiatica DSM 12278]